MNIRQLTKDDTGILKGIAILGILMHNFLHWIEPLDCQENEFGFIRSNIDSFFTAFHDKPTEFFNIIMSYFGHFGVQIFIFISGFGLAMSMANKTRGYGRFLLDRLKKLYPLVIIAFVFYFFSTIIMSYRFVSAEEMKSFGYKFLLIHTLVPGEGESICGPWWFFGLITQLYLLFPLVYWLIRKFGAKAFAVICLVSYAIVYTMLYAQILPKNLFIMQNFPGHLPEFALGILFACNNGKKANIIFFFAAIVIFCLGNFFKVFFPLTFLCLTYIMICGYMRITEWTKGKIFGKSFFAFFGSISMVLFATHGEFRWQFVAIAKNHANAGFTILMLLLFLIAAVIIALGANAVYKWMLSLVERRKAEIKE